MKVSKSRWSCTVGSRRWGGWVISRPRDVAHGEMLHIATWLYKLVAHAHSPFLRVPINFFRFPKTSVSIPAHISSLVVSPPPLPSSPAHPHPKTDTPPSAFPLSFAALEQHTCHLFSSSNALSLPPSHTYHSCLYASLVRELRALKPTSNAAGVYWSMSL